MNAQSTSFDPLSVSADSGAYLLESVLSSLDCSADSANSSGFFDGASSISSLEDLAAKDALQHQLQQLQIQQQQQPQQQPQQVQVKSQPAASTFDSDNVWQLFSNCATSSPMKPHQVSKQASWPPTSDWCSQQQQQHKQQPQYQQRQAGQHQIRQPIIAQRQLSADPWALGDPLQSLRSCLGDVMATGGIAPSSGAERELYSRKVFVGGLPPDVDEEEIACAFRRFGSLTVDWPHKQESQAYFPPKGYCFILFHDEPSVQRLMDVCIAEGDKFYWCVSSPTVKDKPVQVRPWLLSDSDFVLDSRQPLDPRKTVFVGGVPRPLRARDLAVAMERLFGGVCYAGIDTDPDLRYPKGAGRVAFASQRSYVAAVSARFVQLAGFEAACGATPTTTNSSSSGSSTNNGNKRVEVKPFVLDDQSCDRCHLRSAPLFCASPACLRYFCDQCWPEAHAGPGGRQYHRPTVRDAGSRMTFLG
uniref:RRM domain-containing protein n=2 Tax=Macrostomum lignano TaxID=282301 RepID=A0A1I8HVY9_9PLAT